MDGIARDDEAERALELGQRCLALPLWRRPHALGDLVEQVSPAAAGADGVVGLVAPHPHNHRERVLHRPPILVQLDAHDALHRDRRQAQYARVRERARRVAIAVRRQRYLDHRAAGRARRLAGSTRGASRVTGSPGVWSVNEGRGSRRCERAQGAWTSAMGRVSSSTAAVTRSARRDEASELPNRCDSEHRGPAGNGGAVEVLPALGA